jgi:hypothetical protein
MEEESVMRQRWLLNLVLLGVALMLGLLIFFSIEEPTELPKLIDLEAEQLQSIHIERVDSKPISFMKDTLGFWQMTTPLHLPASRFRIMALLEMLSAREYKELDTSELNLAELKLAPPLATVKFNQLTVAFGDSSPMNDRRRYVLINQKVYLLADTVYDSVNADTLSFVSLSPLGNNPTITELKMPDYLMVLTEGEWTLTSTLSSDEIDSSQDAIKHFIENWQQLQAFRVAPYLKGSTQKQIDIRLLNQEEVLHFTMMSSEQDFILGLPEKGVQYQLPISQVDKLLHLPTKAKVVDSTVLENKKEE